MPWPLPSARVDLTRKKKKVGKKKNRVQFSLSNGESRFWYLQGAGTDQKQCLTGGRVRKQMEQLGKAAMLSTTPTSHSHHLTATATAKKKKNCYDLHYVETSCTDGIRSNTARIRTGKITCYSFVFGTLTIEDHVVVLEIFPLLIPF